MGNERDYDDEYEQERGKQYKNEVSWSGLAKEDRVYEFKLTPTPPGYYKKRQATKNSLEVMEGYKDAPIKPQFYTLENKTESPTQNKQNNKPYAKRYPLGDARQKPQQQKKPNWFQRMFGGGKNKKQQKDPKTTTDPRNKTEALDPGWGAGFNDDYFETQEQIREGLAASAPDFISLGLDFTPLAGDVKGVVEAIVGKDIITDDKLPGWARALGAVPLFGGILKQAKAGSKLKAFIKLPGVWVEIRSFGNKFDRLLDYLASKLPGWQQRQRFAMAGGDFEAPPDIAQNMTNAISGSGSGAGKTIIEIYQAQIDPKLWKQAEDGVKNFLQRANLPDALYEEALSTLIKIQDGIVNGKIDISDSGLEANLKQLVGRLNSRQFNIVEENLAELDSAVKVIEGGDVDGAVAIGVTKGQKPKDLPEIDVDKVEADNYYKTTNKVLHIREVKNTPNAFVSKLKEGASREAKEPNYEGQFTRYRRWIEKGADNEQVRQAMVYIRNSEPKFHEIIDNDVLDILSRNIAKENKTETIIQIKNVRFSYDELQEFTKDAYKKLSKLKKKNKKATFSELADQYFNSMEQAFETLGRTYGH